jgi:hypothetical protein
MFLFSAVFKPALGPVSYPIGIGRSFPGVVKRPGRESDHLPPSGAEVKNVGSVLPHPHSLYGVVLNHFKHRDNVNLSSIFIFGYAGLLQTLHSLCDRCVWTDPAAYPLRTRCQSGHGSTDEASGLLGQ